MNKEFLPHIIRVNRISNLLLAVFFRVQRNSYTILDFLVGGLSVNAERLIKNNRKIHVCEVFAVCFKRKSSDKVS